MSVMKKALFAAALLCSKVLAAPLDPRALVVETKTETAWVTIGVTATVWINDADPSAEPSLAPLSAPAPEPTFAPAPAPIVSTSSISTSSAPQTLAAAVVPTPAPVAASAASSAAPAPAVSPAGFAAAAAAAPPVTTTAAPAPAPAASSSAPASSNPVVAAAKPVSASTSGTCEGSGNACTGDVTWYEGGLGACGWNVDTASELSIALPVGFMGSQSNGNPYCGRSVTLLNPTTGTTVKAKVGDKCMGCTDRAIDLTSALFKAIVPNGDGRVKGIQWWLD